MGHVAEDVSRIAHDLVAAMSFDVTDEPYTTHAAAQEEVMGLRSYWISLGSGRGVLTYERVFRASSSYVAAI